MSDRLLESPALASILAGRACTGRAPPGKLKTTQKLIPSPSNPRLQATWQSSPPGFPTLLLSTLAPFLNKISCFVSTHVSVDNSFPSVRQEPSFRPWKGSPFLQQEGEAEWYLELGH